MELSLITYKFSVTGKVEILDNRLERLAKTINVDLIGKFRDIGMRNNVVPKSVITKKLSDTEPIYIVTLADAHLGHMLCNLQKFQETINFILENDNVYCILLGDLAETATRESVGLGMFDENMHASDQLDLLAKLLKPLAVAGKILAIVTGNHEMRIFYMTGLDPSKLLAERLGIPYNGYQAYLNLIVGNQNYQIVAWHGAGGGSTNIGKIKAAEKLKESVLCDVIISGHTHARSYHDDFIDIIQENGQVKRHHRHYIVCGSYLEYSGGYAEMKGLAPSGTGGVIIRLSPDRKDILVSY